jgi:CheY-like chemotaxis protein
VKISVTDHGIGIPKKEIPGIFGRFSRASNARKMQIGGTGFGLYLARQIVELHGGAMSVTSVEGKGSTFIVELPVASASHAEQPLSVLVVENEREQRSFLTHALREAGLRVRVAHTIKDALEALSTEPVDRVAIDTDEVSLDEEERETLERRQSRAGFEIVIIGAAPKAFGRATALVKPFLVQDLLTAIRARS